MKRFLISSVLLVGMVSLVWGHARLLDPPSRASAWRFGWGTPVDYNDNGGFCGGMAHQWEINGGKCGICGDAWDASPREHEAGGTYATGTIVKRYVEGQVISATVEITSNHKGHFEFRICPNNNHEVEATQTCLNAHPLFLADGSGFKYKVPEGESKHTERVQLKLPAGLVCTQCVLQWRYVTGNNWGICPDGTGATGCGNQEEFRACADVAVDERVGGTATSTSPTSAKTFEPTSSNSPTTESPTSEASASPTTTNTAATTTTTSTTTTTTTSTTTTTTATTTATETGTLTCVPVGGWVHVPGMLAWCQANCNHVPSFCPSSHCKCG